MVGSSTPNTLHLNTNESKFETAELSINDKLAVTFIPFPPNVPLFNDDDDGLTGIHTQKDDPMIITVQIMELIVCRVLIDQGSSADILYYDAFIKLGLKDSMLGPFAGALSGEEKGEIKGCIDLQTWFGEGEHSKTINVRYLVVDSVSAYNIIIGRPTLNKLGAIVSTPHLTMKYPLANGKVGVVRAVQKKSTTQS